MTQKRFGTFLFVFLVFSSFLSAQETQPFNFVQDKPATQTQPAAQTQPFDGAQGKPSPQTQPREIPQTQSEIWPKKKIREFALTIGVSAFSSLQPWNSPTRQNERLRQTGFIAGAGMRSTTGFAIGQIVSTPKNKNNYFGTKISAGKTLRKIGGVGFGAGIRYWYANQKQEVATNDFWQVYAVDRWHAGFLSVNAAFGKFNGSRAQVSALVGSIYAATTAEVYSGGKQVGVGQLKEVFIPAYGGEVSGKLQICWELTFTGSVLYVGAPPANFSGRQNTMIPRTNTVLSLGADYVLPFKFFGRTTGTGVQSTFYVSKQEIPIVKRGITVYFSVFP